jgi:urea-proton symporter
MCPSAGIGLFFSAFMLGLTAVQTRYTGFSPKSADEFNSASRSVKPGLIAAGIVSAWTWAATLVCLSLELPLALSPSLTSRLKLQSSAVAYKYGISGPWWYGSGATIQVLLFAQVRIMLFLVL